MKNMEVFIKLKRQVLISFLATCIMIALMAWQGSALKTATTPFGILDLEFAKNEIRLYEILSVLPRNELNQNIYLDFLFIFAYSWFFFSTCKHIAVKRKNKNAVFIGHFFTALSVFAGLFDVAENIFMLLAISQDPQFIVYPYYLAFIKFVLAGIILFYIIISFPVVFRKEN